MGSYVQIVRRRRIHSVPQIVRLKMAPLESIYALFARRVWETQGPSWVSKVWSGLSAPLHIEGWEDVSRIIGWFSVGVGVLTVTLMARGGLVRLFPKSGPWLGETPAELNERTVNLIAAKVAEKLNAAARNVEQTERSEADQQRPLSPSQ